MEETSFRTIMNLRTGQVFTVDEEFAASEIAYGVAVETAPENADAADRWRKAQSEKIVAALHDKYGRQRGALAELLGAMRDYEAFCTDNDLPAFPATEPVVVRYLLARTAGGDLEQQHVSRRAFLLGKLHEETRHPPRHMGETAFNAWTRAIGFASMRLRDERCNIHLVQGKAPAKAFEMFADGVVPRHWHEVAA